MAEFTFVVRGCSLLSFILVEANYVSLIIYVTFFTLSSKHSIVIQLNFEMFLHSH